VGSGRRCRCGGCSAPPRPGRRCRRRPTWMVPSRFETSRVWGRCGKSGFIPRANWGREALGVGSDFSNSSVSCRPASPVHGHDPAVADLQAKPVRSPADLVQYVGTHDAPWVVPSRGATGSFPILAAENLPGWWRSLSGPSLFFRTARRVRSVPSAVLTWTWRALSSRASTPGRLPHDLVVRCHARAVQLAALISCAGCRSAPPLHGGARGAAVHQGPARQLTMTLQRRKAPATAPATRSAYRSWRHQQRQGLRPGRQGCPGHGLSQRRGGLGIADDCRPSPALTASTCRSASRLHG